MGHHASTFKLIKLFRSGMPCIAGDINPIDLIEVILLLINLEMFVFRFLPEHTNVYLSPYKIENEKSESCARVP
jgi:hypothetical protein